MQRVMGRLFFCGVSAMLWGQLVLAVSANEPETHPSAKIPITLMAELNLATPPTSEQLSLDVLKLLLSENSVFDVTNQQVSMNREWVELKRRDNVCVYNKIKTKEREAIALFAQHPLSIFPPVRLQVLTQNRHLFRDEFDFEKDKISNAGKIGIVNGRKYGAFMDNIIATYPEFFFVRSGADSSNKLLEMLLAKRLVAVLEYSAFSLDYISDVVHDQSKAKTIISAVPILGLTEAIAGYVACSRSPKGVRFIQEINRIYQKPDVQKQYIQWHLDYFGPSEAQLLKSTLAQEFAG